MLIFVIKTVMKWILLFLVRLRWASMVALPTTMAREEVNPLAQHTSVLGINVAILVFQGLGLNDAEHVVPQKRLALSILLTFPESVPTPRIGMDTCVGVPMRGSMFPRAWPLECPQIYSTDLDDLLRFT